MTEPARVLHTPRCPVCGDLPADPLFSLAQLVCGNEACEAFMWDPLRPGAEQVADPSWTSLIVNDVPVPAPEPGRVPGGIGSPGQGDPQDRANEMLLRALYHRNGYRCAAGCPICQVAESVGRDAATVEQWLDDAQVVVDRVRREDGPG